ncbi:MAG: BlaI/MecI/CopY family transcriptional regulator [Phycisphaerales bacterium]|nr:MAG: BlaI/MecI/CopY family transcriptional regulator [Phycisphaerales bacterium]
MAKAPKITEAEWEVMMALWAKSPLTANDVVDILSKKTHWQRETIRTLINRLVQKKALGFKKDGRQYHYYPLVDQTACIKAETRSLLRRFGGAPVEPMLAALVEEQQLSPDQIERLKQILAGEGAPQGRRHKKRDA